MARYELLDEIARGGMGSIHRARDRFTSRQVAYKRMIASSEGARARATALFRREYETLARLPHPNIVQVYDYGIDDHGPFYVMELLSGDDLTKVAPLAPREACRILRDVASALALVHARGLLHRDVSPNNIRLSDDGRAKLLDFGAVTPFGQAKELVGTPVCIAPECLAGASLDQRVDLYALGAVAYWILTRRTHVRASSFEELESVRDEPLAAPSFHEPAIPRALDDLVLSLLARDPLARPDSAAAVIERLTAIAELPSESDERAVAFSYLAHPPLVGREQVLTKLRASVDSALRGSGSSLLIEAQRGVGRSAAVESVAFYAQSNGANVIRLRGDREGEAFAAVRSLVESLTALYPDLKELMGSASSRPHSESAIAPSRVDSAANVAERHASILGSAQRIVLEAATRAPLLLLVDDFDQLDESSGSLVASLSSVIANRAIAIVASIEIVTPAARSPVVRLYATHAASIVLEPLRAEEMMTLVRSVFGAVPNSASFAKWIHVQSDGRPATAMDVARLLLQQGSISYQRGTFSLPQEASRALANTPLAHANLARLGAVGADARKAALALALHGRALQLQHLQSALAMPLADVVLAVEQLVQAGIVMMADGAVTLTSPTMGAALVSNTADDERRHLHRQLGEALLACDGGLDKYLASTNHFLRAGMEQRATEAVAPFLQQLFTQASVTSPWVSTLEEMLEVYKRQGRRKEECLSLMMHIVNAGFYGDLGAQMRHIDLTLEWMSLICGMTLARRLRRFVGPKLALVFGLLYAVLRRAFAPKATRVGTITQMLDVFSLLVGAAVAAAASAIDTATAVRATSHLEPFAALPPDSPGYLLREFCLATCDIARGSIAPALERYERLLKVFSNPVKQLDDDSRRQLYLGCLNGIAQGNVWSTSKRVLEASDDLAQDPFFAPHAEAARMLYYAYRGERDQANACRTRVEMAALQGGTSWSALVSVAGHAGQVATRTRDHVALIQAIAEQRRLAHIAPNLNGTADACEAWLEHLRGNSAQAARRYEQFVFLDDAQQSVGGRGLLASYATVLCALGRFEEAKRCSLLALEGGAGAEPVPVLARDALISLAFAEQGLGDPGAARALMERALREIEPDENPLTLGNAHRDCAQLALLQGDAEAFERHFATMQGHYAATNHPSLLVQVEALATEAERVGIRRARVSVRNEGLDDFDGETTIEALEAANTDVRLAN